MNTATPPPPPPATPQAAPPRRLVRLPDQGKVGGVAAGLGWYFGIDPVLIRIGLVVATLASGIGIPAYLIAWVVLPEEKGPAAAATPAPPRDGRGVALVGVALLAVLLLAGQIDVFSGEVIAAAILIGLGVLLFTDTDVVGRLRGTPPAQVAAPWVAPQAGPAAPGAPAPGVPASGSSAPGPVWPQPPPGVPGPGPAEVGLPAWQPAGPTPQSAYQPYAAGWQPEAPPAPPKLRSLLGALTFGVWLLGAGVVALLDRIGAVDVTPLLAIALTLVVLGTGMVIGTFFGNGRDLLWAGVPLLFVLIPLGALSTSDVSLGDGVGERRFAPQTVEQVPASYDLLLGTMTVDLRELDLERDDVVPIDVGLAAGELIVIVPDDVTVTIDAHLQAGELSVLGESLDGTALSLRQVQERPAAGEIVLQVDVLAGEVTVESQPRPGATSTPATSPTPR